MGNIEKLPKWAQYLITEQAREHERLVRKYKLLDDKWQKENQAGVEMLEVIHAGAAEGSAACIAAVHRYQFGSDSESEPNND